MQTESMPPETAMPAWQPVANIAWRAMVSSTRPSNAGFTDKISIGTTAARSSERWLSQRLGTFVQDVEIAAVRLAKPLILCGFCHIKQSFNSPGAN